MVGTVLKIHVLVMRFKKLQHLENAELLRNTCLCRTSAARKTESFQSYCRSAAVASGRIYLMTQQLSYSQDCRFALGPPALRCSCWEMIIAGERKTSSLGVLRASRELKVTAGVVQI